MSDQVDRMLAAIERANTIPAPLQQAKELGAKVLVIVDGNGEVIFSALPENQHWPRYAVDIMAGRWAWLGQHKGRDAAIWAEQ